MKNWIIISILVIIADYYQSAFAQGNNKINCKIWKTDNFCSIPDTLTFPKMHHSHFSYLPWKKCDEIQKMKHITLVRITLPRTSYSKIVMNRGLKSVVLLSKDGKKVRPVGLLWNNLKSKDKVIDYGYITKIKAFKFELDSDNNQDISLVLLFPIAEIGDIITFKKLFSVVLDE